MARRCAILCWVFPWSFGVFKVPPDFNMNMAFGLVSACRTWEMARPEHTTTAFGGEGYFPHVRISNFITLTFISCEHPFFEFDIWNWNWSWLNTQSLIMHSRYSDARPHHSLRPLLFGLFSQHLQGGSWPHCIRWEDCTQSDGAHWSAGVLHRLETLSTVNCCMSDYWIHIISSRPSREKIDTLAATVIKKWTWKIT